MAQFQNQKNKLKSGFYHNSWVDTCWQEGRSKMAKSRAASPSRELKPPVPPTSSSRGCWENLKIKTNKRHFGKRFENTKIHNTIVENGWHCILHTVVGSLLKMG